MSTLFRTVPPQRGRWRMGRHFTAAVCLSASACGLAHASLSPDSPQPVQPPQAQRALQSLAVPFEANSGQFDPAVAFTGRTFAGAVHVTHQGQIVYSLTAPVRHPDQAGRRASKAPPQAPPRQPPGTVPDAQPERRSGWSLTETLAGALPLSPRGGEAAATQITRFSGPGHYQSATYRNLHLGQAWPGVQVELAVRGANVEKLFHVAPQADASQIRVQVGGALSLRLGEGGELLAATGHGDVAYTAPVAFQEVAGRRVDVPVRYALDSQGDGYGFALGAYDRDLPLVIDPLLQSTYLGGAGEDSIRAMALTPSGDIVVAGSTWSDSFPGTQGGVLPVAGNGDGFIARLSGDLGTLLQSTYLGGTEWDMIYALAVTPSGDVMVGGVTESVDLPGTADGYQAAGSGGGQYDGFIARLSGDLRTLVRSTYLGGAQWTEIFALALTASGEVVVGGRTFASDFPGTAGAAQPVAGGSSDGFVARLSGDLRTLVRSTYLGGNSLDQVTALAITPSGGVVAGGETFSAGFPGVMGGPLPMAVGNGDGFIARLSPDLRILVQSTYLGGAGWDRITALTVAPSGEVVVGGFTQSGNLPGVAGAAQPAAGGGLDGFATVLSGDLLTLVRSTYLGGPEFEAIYSLATTSSGEVVVAGYTESAGFPGTDGAVQPAPDGVGGDGFIARLSGDLRALLQSTYLSGSGPTAVTAVVIEPSGDVLVGGATTSEDFPGVSGSAQPDPGGGGDLDGFIARLTIDLRALSSQTITFPAQADQVLASPGATFTIDPPATASSDLPVNYISHTPDICTVSGTTVTLLDAGTCTLEARQPGTVGQWLAANGVRMDITVRKPQAISFPQPPGQTFVAGGRFTLDEPATASSGLPVAYASTTPGVCTVSGTTVTMVGEGTCTLTASQPGNALWVAAADASRDIELVAAVPPGPGPGPGPGAAAATPIPALHPGALALLAALAAGWGTRALRRRNRQR
jgi:hypothetical protein